MYLPYFFGSLYRLQPVYNIKQKWKGGQSGTYIRLTRASSGPRVSVTKTYRDEMKMNISARSQWPSSVVEYRRLTAWGRPPWSGQNIHFHLVSSPYVLATLTRGPDDALIGLRGKCRSVPLPYLFISLILEIKMFSVLDYLIWNMCR